MDAPGYTDPVHSEAGKWYFYDETWADRQGPFDTEAEARASLKHYVLFLEYGPDYDLQGMSKDELIAEVKRLRAGIRTHRDARGHNLCWYVPELWGLSPGEVRAVTGGSPTRRVPPKLCYLPSLSGPRMTHV